MKQNVTRGQTRQLSVFLFSIKDIVGFLVTQNTTIFSGRQMQKNVVSMYVLIYPCLKATQ